MTDALDLSRERLEDDTHGDEFRRRAQERADRLSEIGSAEGPDFPRFWDKAMVGGPDDCWEWMASRDANGYGKFHVTHTDQHRAHRVAYELKVGRIPDGLVLDHLCRNRACVNPAHLEPVTNEENIRRGERANQTHCKHGHEFTPENTYTPPSRPAGRMCKTCMRRFSREWHRRKSQGAGR